MWCSDITWLPGPICGQFTFLYLIIDLYSRKIVGWEVHEVESSVHAFSDWYNTVHRHRGIQPACCGRYVTPQQRHSGEDVAILRQRHEVYDAARRQHPTRWSGNTRNWGHIREVWLNPENDRALTTKVD